MDDLISRQAAIDAIAKFVPYAICDESTESYTNGLTDAYNLICQLPSAQPEIIRCRDCKHYSIFENESNGMCGLNVDARVSFYPWSFCSKAERR